VIFRKQCGNGRKKLTREQTAKKYLERKNILRLVVLKVFGRGKRRGGWAIYE